MRPSADKAWLLFEPQEAMDMGAPEVLIYPADVAGTLAVIAQHRADAIQARVDRENAVRPGNDEYISPEAYRLRALAEQLTDFTLGTT